MRKQIEIRQQITDRIVVALQAGTVPWRRPWSSLENSGSPANVVSRRSYSGINALILPLVSTERNWTSRWFGTFRQWNDLGFRIKPRPSDVATGHWGTRVVFCKGVNRKPTRYEVDTEENQEIEVEDRDRPFLVLREYTVFNAEQVEGDGIENYLARPRTTTGFDNYIPAEEVIKATNARIEFGGNRAVYFHEEDFIRLPVKEAFESQKEYYSTALHELLHWSGHENRLGRLNKNARFGNEAYAIEELVAEMGGYFLCNEVGVPQSGDLSNQAAYLASWLAVLQADPTAIFTAASQASSATDFILSFSRKDHETSEENEAVAAVAGA